MNPKRNENPHTARRGKSSAEISEQYFISKHTVNTLRKNLLEKTGCTKTADLIAHALKRGRIWEGRSMKDEV
ncbi:response regulator transcription factor [Pollutibacter soli]|uniref:response regulator transcription factor n=1 Tax=Pollutibacter soli TaxID=3034157 RepID=UPI003AF99088